MTRMAEPTGLRWFEWAIVVVILVLLVLATLMSGCATTRQTCRFEHGELVEITTRATVVGQGTTRIRTAPARRKGDFVTANPCGYLDYSTEDTGLSQNAVSAIGAAAEGAARGASPLP